LAEVVSAVVRFSAADWSPFSRVARLLAMRLRVSFRKSAREGGGGGQNSRSRHRAEWSRKIFVIFQSVHFAQAYIVLR